MEVKYKLRPSEIMSDEWEGFTVTHRYSKGWRKEEIKKGFDDLFTIVGQFEHIIIVEENKEKVYYWLLETAFNKTVDSIRRLWTINFEEGYEKAHGITEHALKGGFERTLRKHKIHGYSVNNIHGRDRMDEFLKDFRQDLTDARDEILGSME